MGCGEESLPAKIRWFVYLSHSLSTWGDRMWSFGVGLFMVIVSPESLRVTAVYGLSMGTAVLLFGALVGDWIDRTPRLQAARTSLVVQNTSVIACACMVYVVITWKLEIQTFWPHERLLTLCYGAIILVAILSTLGSMGTNIAIQKDWIVEICGRDKDLLATMTATLRRIDLFSKLVAPIATGQIMYFASVGMGAMFIAGWNLVSVFVEYIILWKVYSLVPALRSKKFQNRAGEGQEEPVQEMLIINSNQGNDTDIGQKLVTSGDKVDDTETLKDVKYKENEEKTGLVAIADKVGDTEELKDDKYKENEEKTGLVAIADKVGDSENLKDNDRNENKEDVDVIVTIEVQKRSKDSFVRKMFSGFIILYHGWKTYIKYDVAFAGLGLSCIYMTVLGFDNITVGFLYTQGINESILGAAMAAGALVGILATFVYPLMRKRIGLERTGLFGFFFEMLFLCLCVASIWAPGSPFDPLHNKQRTDNRYTNGAKWNMECNSPLDNISYNLLLSNSSTDVSRDLTNQDTLSLVSGIDTNVTNQSPGPVICGLGDGSITNESNSGSDSPRSKMFSGETELHSHISVWLLLAGIIGARCGVWMIDLSVTQLFLEHVSAPERGIVNGVQTSLNKVMDMLKFLMVIGAPQQEVFGILILVSFMFIIFGWLSFAKYSHTARGHLFHFEKIRKLKCGDTRNNNNLTSSTERV